ncbi:TetR family transcriptional regulator [Chelatococcus reniformis]|uniref:TetR family transcriptional regulator n=2 Tax=Chelatococcus reniformis TaxID=1494448 RepID=A0A916UM45_9HYPH|nr:TetR family transcriptional regulator [Chelatococcus reniformis]
MVGKYGYAEASISRITEAANVAQGTFYNYFETRQAILDLLPPRYAQKMNEYIASRMEPGLCGVDREVRRLEAFFDFFRETKESARLVNEATVMAPEGFARFGVIVRKGYIRALERSMERGEIERMDPKELGDVADLLISIRNGLSHMMLSAEGNRKRVPKRFFDSYRKFVAKALFR